MSHNRRIRNPCDGCTLRRVKCEDTKPCCQCRVRGIECTTMHIRKKRGPKGGPRRSPSVKIREFQKSLIQSVSPTSSVAETEADRQPETIPLDEYRRFILLFQQQAIRIWPVVNSDDLLIKLDQPDPDPETMALAASLCAATIAQLRLAEHSPDPSSSPDSTTSSHFATECQRFRHLYDYRETYSLASVLIPFFLHIYYANAGKLRTAGLLLRESITYVHVMHLGRPQTYRHLDKREQSLRLRVYWLLFISERTYCAQHLIPAILQPIDTPPAFEDDDTGDNEGLPQTFKTLSHLFVHLDGDFTATPTTPPSEGLPSPSAAVLASEKQKLISYQTRLSLIPDNNTCHEAQRVDLFVTRQWIRVLLWEYTARRFVMACCPADGPAFSLLLPVTIGRELLGFLSGVGEEAVRLHGYGMELKIFRLADAVMDLIACVTVSSARSNAMLAASGEVLHAFRRVLVTVGGRDSAFSHKLHLRMSQLVLDRGTWPYRALLEPEKGMADECEDASSGESSYDGLDGAALAGEVGYYLSIR